MAKNAKPQVKLYVPPTSVYVPPPIDLGLFFWGTDLTKAEQTKITAWYRSLDAVARGYVDTLREEQRDETQFECDYDG